MDSDAGDEDKKVVQVTSAAAAASEEESLSKLEKYYLSVVIKALMSILRDPVQMMHHQTAINISSRIIRTLGRKSHYETDEVVDGIFARIRSVPAGGSNMQISLIEFLCVVIHATGSHISKHYSRIATFICDYFSLYLQPCLNTLETLYRSIPLQDFGYLIRFSDTIPMP